MREDTSWARSIMWPERAEREITEGPVWREGTPAELWELSEWNCRQFRCGSRLASRVLLPLATGRLVLRILACRGWRLSCITLQLFELLHLLFCLSRFSSLAVESRQTEMRLRRQWTLALNRSEFILCFF